MTGPDAQYGTYNRTNFMISVWVSRQSLTNNNHNIVGQWGASGQRAWFLRFTDNDLLEFQLTTNNSTTHADLITTNSFATLSNWIHIALKVNLAQAISTNKVKIWTNAPGQPPFECTYLTTNYPASSNPMFNSTNSPTIGSNWTTGKAFWGQIDEYALVSGSNDLTSVDFMDASYKPKDLSAISGIFFWARGGDNGINNDQVITSTPWTNNGSVIGSPRVP